MRSQSSRRLSRALRAFNRLLVEFFLSASINYPHCNDCQPSFRLSSIAMAGTTRHPLSHDRIDRIDSRLAPRQATIRAGHSQWMNYHMNGDSFCQRWPTHSLRTVNSEAIALCRSAKANWEYKYQMQTVIWRKRLAKANGAQLHIRTRN